MAVSSEAYRDALRHFPSGVTVVTVLAGGQKHGLTVSAFASVSPEPPLVVIAIDHRHKAHEMLAAEDAAFAVNVLCQDQDELSNRFAWVKDEDRFAVGDWGEATTGAPVLRDALAWLDCAVVGRHRAGTHTLYVGEVRACASPRHDCPPLVYWNRGYRRLDLVDDEG